MVTLKRTEACDAASLKEEGIRNWGLECAQSVWRGFRNAVIAGYRIRLPYVINALVMYSLSRDKSSKSRIKFVIKQLFWHCHNLAMFVAIYKAVSAVLRKLGLSTGLDALIAGGVGGWIAFGAQSGISGAVNQQINLYLLARGVEGLLKMAARRFSLPAVLDVRKPLGFRVLTAGTIATTMYMMDYEPDTLRDGLTQAMHSIYHASNAGSVAVPLPWWPLVAGAMALIGAPFVNPKWRLEHLVTLF